MVTEDVSDVMEEKSKVDREHQLLLDAANKAKIGSWEMNHVTNELYWSRVTKKIHQVDQDYVPDVATGINFYKPGINQEIVTDLFTLSVISSKVPYCLMHLPSTSSAFMTLRTHRSSPFAVII